MTIEINHIKELSVRELKPLVQDSQKGGFSFVQLLVDEWMAKINCFNKSGEILLLAKDNHPQVQSAAQISLAKLEKS